MNRILTIAFAALFAVSAGAFAASHMKGDKDTKATSASDKSDKKGGDMKSDAKKGKDDKKKM